MSLDPRLVASVAAQLLRSEDLREVLENGALKQYGTLGTVKQHLLRLAAGQAADLVQACIDECDLRKPIHGDGNNASKK